MSLHKAVYQTVDVTYYAEITQPTPNLVGFLSRLAHRLGDAGEATALFHLDQGMGGGKSHALVGLFHMANDPVAFFATDLGAQVLAEAHSAGGTIDLAGTRVVTLTADNFSPGKTSETFGPATNLFGRFLWGLFDKDRDRYDDFLAKGANKATIRQALETVDRPILILLDELMDYVMALSDAQAVGTMPSEKTFLNALADACDDVAQVSFVVVMIRSELDQEGYTPLAEDFRTYIAKRLERNGTKVAVTETGDFAAIIRRRIFEQPTTKLPAGKLAKAFQAAIGADPAWSTQVFDRLGAGRHVATLQDRIAETYPFHPELMDLVQNEWAKTQGFQRVRSTVAIFALAALHWTRAASADSWAPPLIGVGDLPLNGIQGAGSIPQARCLDALLNSGLLLGNDRAIQGYRAVATTDITSADGSSGRAVEIDGELAANQVDVSQPQPAARMASALFNYSLVGRAQGKRGATKAELMAALLVPRGSGSSSFADVEQVFIHLTGEAGLGALKVAQPSNAADRFWLTINQTLRMFFTSANSQISDDQAEALVWETAQILASKGPFEGIFPIDQPTGNQTLSDVAAGMDSQANRLVIIDPRYWTLLNGDDTNSRADILGIFGVGPDALVVDNAASCVVAAVNTYQRRYANQAARDVLTWRLVLNQVSEDDERADVQRKLVDAEENLKARLRGAYRQFSYITRKGDDLEAVFAKFDDDQHTSLSGADVWDALVTAGRAVGEHMDPDEKRRKRISLSEKYLALLLDSFDRHLTLKDLVSSFYKDPRFPLVPSIDEIRQAVYGLLQPADHAGEGTGGWTLIGSDGGTLNVGSPDQLAISSIQQQLRRAGSPSVPAIAEDTTTSPAVTNAGTSSAEPAVIGSDAADKGPSSEGAEASTTSAPKTYSWYRVDVTNRSIADEARREAVRAHLLWLASKLDEDELDHQLMTLRYEINAATSGEFADELRQRAEGIQAGKVNIEEDL